MFSLLLVFHFRLSVCLAVNKVTLSLSQHALLTLIRALVVSKVDYCCSVLTGVSSHLLSRLQSIMNAAARLIFYARRSEHVTPLLHDLHWLWVPERIQFRLCYDILVSSWFCAIIPGQQSSSHRRCRWSSASAFIRRDHARRPVQAQVNVRRPCLPSGRTKDLEPFAHVNPGRNVLIDVSSRTEDIPFPL